jgi:prepilin signal peptidase PulO-like enzyme (type II secretory pathway)
MEVWIFVWSVTELLTLLLWERFYVKRNEELAEALARKPLVFEAFYIGVSVLLAGISAFFVYKYASGTVSILRLLAAYMAISMAALVDFLNKKIPNLIIGGVFAIRIILLVPELILEPEQWMNILGSSLISVCLVFLVLLVLSRISRGGFGMGDVKLLTAHAFMCGVYAVINTLLFGLISCVLAAIVLVMTSKKGLKDTIAFGPFLYIGYIISLLLGAF